MWATRASDGTIRVIAINKGSTERDLALRLPGKPPPPQWSGSKAQA